MNNVSLIGRLTRDPELVTTQGGTEICNVRIALDRRGQDGAVYTDVKCFGKQGLAVAEHKCKGDQIAVTGRLELDEWETASGSKRSVLYVIGERVEFLGRRSQNGDGPSAEEAAGEEPVGAAAGGEEDIPF